MLFAIAKHPEPIQPNRAFTGTSGGGAGVRAHADPNTATSNAVKIRIA
jgi:hypothetical protein